MSSTTLLDICGRRRSPATLPSFHRGQPPRNKGQVYAADPPTVDEIIAVMRAAGNSPEGVRLCGVIVVLWRAGLRISEALALNETDLDADRGALLIRHGKGDKRREVGMDRWAWSHLDRGSSSAVPYRPAGCSARCAVRHEVGRARQPGSERNCTRRRAAGVRRRFAPHQLRHAHAVEMAREGISLIVIQRQLGHYAGDPVKCHRLGGRRARRRGSGRSTPRRAVASRRSGSGRLGSER